MVVAITARTTDLDARIDPRFGRAETFVLVDTVTGTTRSLDNHTVRGAVEQFQAGLIQEATAGDVQSH